MKLILAVDLKNGIAKDGKIPWYLRTDMKLFRAHTMGETIIMGRSTFESIGKVLPYRETIVVSSKRLSVPTIGISELKNYPNAIIIGGAQLVEAAQPFIDRAVITRIQADYNCDTIVDLSFLTKVEEMSKIYKDENNTDDAIIELWKKY
jgi:dihydrofolate reductase